MAKKAAARRSTAKKRAKSATRRAAGTRAAARTPRVGVDFKRMHDEMDAALERLKARKPSIKRDLLILKLRFIREVKFCPRHGMVAALE
jgi:hypothetical protein